jgi:sulfide:quinone oxidoreductase
MKNIVIVGGGSAGMTVASKLAKRNDMNITIIDPASKHYYQPAWTLVGGGDTKMEDTVKDMKDIMPKGVKHILEAVKGFSPEENIVHTQKQDISYDYLIVAAGIQIDWNLIEGLTETLGKNGVTSNYNVNTVEKTWEFLQQTKKGNALFTFPNTPIKCAGAPQKIMYLAEEHFRRTGVRQDINVEFVSAGGGIFGVQKYKDALEKVVKERNIETSYRLNLVKVDGSKKIATFKNEDTGEIVDKEFSFLHVAPPMSSPDFIKMSPLASEGGWVDVHKHTLQHVKYQNVFSLGDASSLPTSKTGAAIRKEAPVLVANLLSHIKGKPMVGHYDGYTSCPLVTGYGKLILAEFDYSGNPAETFPFNQAKERRSMYFFKKYLLPLLYWQGMLKGRKV